MIKGYVRYCDRCGVELTKANNTCGFELCDKCNEALEQQLAIKNDLSVPEVTALAEWIEKLTKASEDAYNKGYEDGMKAQAEPKTKIEESNFSREQYVLDIDTAWKCGYEAGKKENSPINICPHCGEYIGEEE